MSQSMDELKRMVKSNLTQLTATPAFSDWFKKAEAADGDIVVVNNSFIYRKPLIKTSKNKQYLALKVKGRKVKFQGGFCRPARRLRFGLQALQCQGDEFVSFGTPRRGAE